MTSKSSHRIIHKKQSIHQQLALSKRSRSSQDSYIPSAHDEGESSIFSYDNEEESINTITNRAAQVEKESENIQFDIEKMILARIVEKVSNFQNKLLYPPFLGPHPIYAKESVENDSPKISVVELKTKLCQWFQVFYSNKFSSMKVKNVLKNRNFSDNIQQNSGTLSNKQKVVRKQKITGIKYNSYSIQFKMNVVRKIQAKLMKKQGKTLRNYICQQAKLLDIHPKNITRWFETKNLDRTQGGRKARFPILEYKLAKLIQQNPKIKRRQVINEGKKILYQAGEGQNFSFSKGWYERFRIRMRDHKVERSMQRIINEDSQKDETKINIKNARNTFRTYSWKQKECGDVKLEHNQEYVSKLKIEQGFGLKNERRDKQSVRNFDD